MIEKKHNKIIPVDLFEGGKRQSLDKEAIAFFSASGFFAENDSYWKNDKWEALDFENQSWRYAPRDITLSDAVDEFAELFHQIVAEQTKEGKAILALSGGLDSRTLAVAMKVLGKNPYCYSYRFTNSLQYYVCCKKNS